MNGIVVLKREKRFLFKIEKEYKEKFVLYKIPFETAFWSKKLYKKLEKDRILNVAFDNNISHSFIKDIENKINVVTKENVLINNLDKIILKAANSLGIKEGKLTLGIVVDNDFYLAIKKIKNVRSKLKTLYVYCKDTESFLKDEEDFYKSTGVPVVIKKDMLSNTCDILVYLTKEVMDFEYNGFLIDILDITTKKGVRDIKKEVVGCDNIYNISDSVFLKIIMETFDIDSFITKNA